MKLLSIDKVLFQQRYKVIAGGLALTLAILGLGFSSLLIAFFGEPEGNTLLNFIGVVTALGVLLLALQKLKLRPYFQEVYYVWTLKQELNVISRKMRQIKAAAQEGDRRAMTVLAFSYAGSRQLWSLEDNTLVMDDLALWEQELQDLQQRFDVTVSVQEYSRELVKLF